MKTLVVFYSRDGLTKKVALSLADLLQADSEELVDLTDRRGIWGWLYAGRDALKRRLTKLQPLGRTPDAYDLGIIGSPYWAGNMAPAVRTFLAENSGRIRQAAFFCAKGDNGPAKKLFSEMEAVGRLRPLATMQIARGDDKTGVATHKILQFVDEIKRGG